MFRKYGVHAWKLSHVMGQHYGEEKKGITTTNWQHDLRNMQINTRFSEKEAVSMQKIGIN